MCLISDNEFLRAPAALLTKLCQAAAVRAKGKGIADAKRAKLYARFGKQIVAAVKEGGEQHAAATGVFRLRNPTASAATVVVTASLAASQACRCAQALPRTPTASWPRCSRWLRSTACRAT